jgi:hypothetical protein
MTDLEKYLRQASRGLWGRERQTVRRELESHIRHRANRYEVSGSSEQAAIKLAIADLGEAREISSGMKGVYTMPTTIRAGVLTAAIATFVFMGVQLSTAQVTGTTKFLTADCLEGKLTSFKLGKMELFCDSWFSIQIQSLQAVLEPMGVQFQAGDNSTILRWPEGAVSLLSHESTITFIDTKGNAQPPLELVKGYVQITDFLEGLRSSGLPVSIDGWDNPAITVGKTKFTLGSAAQPVIGSSVYPTLLGLRLNYFFVGFEEGPWFYSQEKGAKPDPKQLTHIIRTTLEPGTIAIVLSRNPGREGTMNGLSATLPKHKAAFIAPVGPAGSIEYTSYSRSLAVVNPRDVQVGVRNGHATISVLQFSGEYSNKPTMLEVVKPESIKIISR